MNKLGILLLLAALLAGCTPEGPAATPTAIPATPTVSLPSPAPTPQPTPPPPAATPTVVATTPAATPALPMTVIPIEQEDINCTAFDRDEDIPSAIEEVIEDLGYALQPTVLPEGFALAGVSSANDEVRQIYQNAEKNIIVAYPIEFSPDTRTDPLGWERPEDAVSNLQIGNQTAYLMIGGWSDASIIAGPALKPDRAEWDYDKSVALFFSCLLDSGGSVGIAIQASQASPEPINWIEVADVVEIAQSLRRIPSSP